MQAWQADHLSPYYIQFRQSVGEADRLGQAMFGQTPGFGRTDIRVQHKGPRGAGRGRTVTFFPPCQEREIIVFVFRQI
jgi:hypothetical protein